MSCFLFFLPVLSSFEYFDAISADSADVFAVAAAAAGDSVGANDGFGGPCSVLMVHLPLQVLWKQYKWSSC